MCTVNSGMKKRKAEGERKGPPKITKNQCAGKAPFPAGSDSLEKLGTKDYKAADKKLKPADSLKALLKMRLNCCHLIAHAYHKT